MVPIHLKLKNFLSYREETELDFSQIRIACLSGDNGSGKSALLDAITWAIWGKTRASNDRDVISIGASEMEVTFSFRMGEREYRIFRRRSVNGRVSQSLEFFVRDAAGSDWLQITGDNVRETQEKIVTTLNIEHETFVNSAFILQGRADTFTQNSPNERKKILGDILNLKEYDELQHMARDEERALREDIARTRERIRAIDDRLELRPDLVTQLGITSVRLTEVSERYDLAQQLAGTLALQVNAYAQIEQMLAAARQRAAREEEALRTLSSELEQRRGEQSVLHELIAHADEIESGAAQLERWRVDVQRLSALQRQVQAQIQQQNEAEREIERELAILQRGREKQAQIRSAADQQLHRLEQEAERLHTLRRNHAAAGDPAVQLTLARRTIDTQQEERTRLHGDNTLLKSRMNEIQDNLGRIDAGDANCPVCRRPMSAEDRASVETAWRADGKVLGDTYRANKARMDELDRSIKVLKEDAARCEAAVNQVSALQAMITQAEVGLSQGEAYLEQSQTAAAELERVERIIASQDFALDARRALGDAEAAIAELDYDPVAQRDAEERVENLASYEARKRDLDQAKVRLEGIEQAVAAILRQQQERTLAASEVRDEVAQFEQQLVGAPDLRQRALAAKDEAEQLETERKELWAQQSGLEQRIAELDALLVEREQYEAQASALELDYAAMRELSEAFGRNGIQAMIIENVLPELADEANALLQRMSSGQLRVSFQSQRQLLSRDSIAETLDILIRDEYGERPYALYSGGEAFRINFAVRIALSKLLAKRAGANIDMLVIDEGFGTQDSRGRDGLIEALRSVENDFRMILVITHIGEIREMFPTRIDVVKTERGSQVSVN